METSLIPINIPDPVAVFVGGGIDAILVEVEKKAQEKTEGLTADTASGRKEIASVAHKVSRTKTTIDDIGKGLVSDWKKKAAEVDATRKRSKDFLDGLKEKIRKPVTEWEAAEEAKAAEQKRLEEEERARKQREIEEREAEVARKEKEIKDKEDAARLEKERLEREEKIRKEAQERAEREAKEAIERAKHEAEMAEKRRIEAEERAIVEKELAIKKAREEDLAKQEQARKAAEKAAANKAHRAKINREILACFVENDIEESVAKKVMALVVGGQIKHMVINY